MYLLTFDSDNHLGLAACIKLNWNHVPIIKWINEYKKLFRSGFQKFNNDFKNF